MARRKARSAWASRIVGHADVPPDQLLAHPDNVKIHPQLQQEALEQALDALGWIAPVIVNQRTGHMVDGHARTIVALRRNEPTVPVDYVDLTPEEEALALLTFDPIGALAATDQAKYEETLGLVPDDRKALALLARGQRRADRKMVQFEAKAHLQVVVECEDEMQQQSLIARLTDEGFACRGR